MSAAVLRWHDPRVDPNRLNGLPRYGLFSNKAASISEEAAFIGAKLIPGEQPVAPLPRGRRTRLGRRAQSKEKVPREALPWHVETAKPEPWRGAKGGVIEIEDGGMWERLTIDPEKGPQVYMPDGSIGSPVPPGQRWDEMSTYDQKMLAYKTARRNRSMIEWRGEAFWHPELRRTPQEKKEERCRAEMAKRPVRWRPIGMDEVLKGHKKVSPGMIYGLEFPWSEEMLAEWGPDWLTRAMHAAGTLSTKNRVTSIELERTIKVTGGNNAGKFLFEVTYARHEEDLDTKLFAKVPFAMTKETQTDRISSSVYKQPSDLQEINTYRMLEAFLQVPTPKFYYGDISNETSNFIVITARIPFVGIRKGRPMEVEGPYDKCKDYQLQGPPEEYYSLLMRATGRMAGAYKAGLMGSEDFLATNHFNPNVGRTSPEAWGINPWGVTGDEPGACWKKLEVAYKFISQIARPLFPEYVPTEAFQSKFFDTHMTWNAYRAEVEYWKNSDPDYQALGHMNLNADNAYYWRDKEGKLDCGVIDWGGFGINSVGHKLWWCINCADFEHVRDHFMDYIRVFIRTYHEMGGPMLDEEVIRMMMILTCLGNTMFMVAAVPNCYNMCSTAEFASITDRNDPRVAENVHGKSTLRTTLHVLNQGIRVLEELRADETLAAFVRDVIGGSWAMEPKSEAMINGT